MTLTGKWKITATTPLASMNLIADFVADEAAGTFTGTATNEANGAVYEVVNGKLDGNAIDYDMIIRFGIIPFNFHLNGHFYEDGTCDGVGKAAKMQGSYKGYKL